MSNYTELENARIKEFTSIPTPNQVKNDLQLSDRAKELIMIYRMMVSNIIHGVDKRKLVIIGPCSLHDRKSAIEYAKRLKVLHDKYKDKMLIVMRAYMSKPRSGVGWKGLLMDCDLDGSCRIEKGLFFTRKILLDIVEIGLPLATEWLDPISPQYFSDLISFGAIGARTSSSQIHRELVSGLSMPVGFKNCTSGDVECVANAILAAKASHTFLGCKENGILSMITTTGNTDTVCILRGGKTPNYDAENVREATQALYKGGGNINIIIDCSHGNSYKLHTNQSIVLRDVLDQIQKGNKQLCGVMIESHINAGKQTLGIDPSELKYGISVTDSCISFEESEHLMKYMFDSL